MAAEADADTLQKHIAGTYHNLRLGVGMIGIALPVVLWLGGMLFNREPLRSSMSAYYYAGFFAVVVAMIPTHPGDTYGLVVTVHRAAAVLFFGCIAYVVMFRSSDTLSLIRDTQDAEKLRTVYR